MLDAIRRGERSQKKNTAFRGTSRNPTAIEDRKIKKLKEKISKTELKLNEFKLEMERALLCKEEFLEEIKFICFYHHN